MGVNGVYGLTGSGIDVDAMVKKMMTAQRVPYDKLFQTKTRTEWKKADYNKMYGVISDFRNKVSDLKIQKDQLAARKTTVSTTGVLTATAGPDAVNFNHSVVVKQLAQSASMTSGKAISQSDDAKKDTLAEQLGITDGKISLIIDDGSEYREYNDIKDANGNVIQKDATGTVVQKGLIDYDTTGKSIYDFVADINKLGTNIQASYDATLDRLFLYNKKSGEQNQITIQAADGDNADRSKDLINKLQLAGPDGLAEGQSAVTTKDALSEEQKKTTLHFGVAGTDSEIVLDGMELKQSSNLVTVAGLALNLTGVSEKDAAGEYKPTLVTVGTDVDKIVDSVKKFVDSYNSILDTLNDKIDETYYRDYPPLTNEQREAMSDDQIKAWEDKAKSGMLHNDSTLRSVLSAMRNDIMSPVNGLTGKYNTLASIGVTTGKGAYSYLENGRLEVDEDKLRAAIEDDPDIVDKLFNQTSDTEKNTAATGTDREQQERSYKIYNESGIAQRMYKSLTAALDSIKQIAGLTPGLDGDTQSFLAKELIQYKNDMDDWEDKLNNLQDRYYKQFDAMEVALNKLNQQGSWIQQQFAS